MQQLHLTTENLDSLNRLLRDQCEWSDKTFGPVEESGPVPPLKHLKKEVDEVLAKPNDTMEWADCFLLLIDAARRNGIPFAHLVDLARVKHDICRRRVWNVPKWEYHVTFNDQYECVATRVSPEGRVVGRVDRLLGYGSTVILAKANVQKLIREHDTTPHEHDRSKEGLPPEFISDLPSAHC